MPPADIAIALLVGLALGSVLGLLGGGGGILAIPAFVHILGMPVDEASTTSLLVVAVGATAGLIPHAIAGRVAWRVGLLFGALGTVGSVLGARLALVADDRLQTAGLIALIFLAASGMLRDADDSNLTRMRHRIPAGAGADARTSTTAGTGSLGSETLATPPGPLGSPETPAATGHESEGGPAEVRWLSGRTVLSASVVGLVTGFFGVGGGFVAVPALMWGVGLPVRRATATGLLVIVMNSVVALVARGPDYLAWPESGLLAGAAIVGALLGAALSHRVPSRTLKRSFGWLLIVIGAHEVWQLALLYQ